MTSDAGVAEPPPDERPIFHHPDWTVGLVLVFAAISLLFGVLVRPIFLLIGSPFILILALWLFVRLFGPRAISEEGGDTNHDV